MTTTGPRSIVRKTPIRMLIVATAAFVLAGRGSDRPTLQAAGSSCGATINPIQCENQLARQSASEWDIAGAGDPTIQGFATDISVDKSADLPANRTVYFKINTDAANYGIDIYRLGYYGGMGARKVATVQPSAALPQNQPSCLTEAATGLHRLRQLGDLRVVARPHGRGLRHLRREADTLRTPAAPATSSSSSATTPASRM